MLVEEGATPPPPPFSFFPSRLQTTKDARTQHTHTLTRSSPRLILGCHLSLLADGRGTDGRARGERGKAESCVAWFASPRPSVPSPSPARLPLRHKVLRISGYLPLAGGREAVVPRCCTPRSVDRSRRSRKITLEENTGREVAGEIAFPENKRRVPLLALLLHPHLVCENTVKENRTVSRSQEYFQGEKKRSSPSSLLLLPLSSCCCSKPLCVCVCVLLAALVPPPFSHQQRSYLSR